MSNSKLASKFIKAYDGNYSKNRTKWGGKIKKITIHHVAGVVSIENLGKLWQRKGRNGSSHYGIGNDGRIGQYVDEKDVAWTDSNWNSNKNSVTIETSNSKTGGNWPVSDKALNSLIKLVADIGKRNNLGTLVKGKNVTWHSMYANTYCPGNYLRGKMDYIISEANKINNKSTSSKPSSSSSSNFLGKRGYLKYGDSGENVGKIASFMYKTFPSYTKKAALGNYFGKNLLASIKEFQRRTGLEADGNIGPLTLKMLVKYGFKY